MDPKYLILVLGVNDLGKPILIGRFKTESVPEPSDLDPVLEKTAEVWHLPVDDFKNLFNPNAVVLDMSRAEDIKTFSRPIDPKENV